MIDPVAQLVTAIKASTQDQTFQKLTLGKFQNNLSAVKHVYVRLVDLKTGPHLSFVYRHPNQDIIKNTVVPEGIALLAEGLGWTSRFWTLLTTKRSKKLR